MHRIVWREDPNKPIQDYRLLTATYGTASRPFHATRVLHKLAEDEERDLPLASAVARRDFYVDDVMSGANTESEALEVQSQLLELMKRGGMDLRKWSSNSAALLESLPSELRETQLPLNFDSDEAIKTLGLRWNPATDEFGFKVFLPPVTVKITKRSLLSEMSKVFDPLGWLAPCLIRSKILFQKLWKLDCGWDDALPDQVREEWLQFRGNLHKIEEIKISRCIVPAGARKIYILGFCDASEKAYAGAVYLRVDIPDSEPVISLVAAKTRVAPSKQISLPRLELCGALLLSHLIENVKEAHKLQIAETRAWTDSTVVLAWLKAHPSRWKAFVANRVSEVQELVPFDCWAHVKGVENPADCASRGIDPSELPHHHLWWTGPSWLKEKSIPSSHPSTTAADEENVKKEEREMKVSVHQATTVPLSSILYRHSSLTAVSRTTAWWKRFVHNCRAAKSKQTTDVIPPREGPLSLKEVNDALLSLIKMVQRAEFHTEIRQLELQTRKAQSHPTVPANSKLRSLNPFLDHDGVLRVGGRLRHSQLPRDQKHPILIPRRHQLTTLLINQAHENHLHAGAQLTLSVLQRRYWIVGAKDAVRHQIKKCVKCTRHSGKTAQQFMADLPAVRVTPCRPFLKTGVDYAGPFLLRDNRPRSKVNYKAYLSLFICMSTRAVHLEVVSSLSTNSFLDALRRFVARRGRCSDIYSDNGTNFVGANKELKQWMTLVQSPAHNHKVVAQCVNEGIQWHFNPPAAPHFGGLWEAGVKSVKTHLYKVIGSTRLTFEEMTTVMTQIEACLNSRPLTPASSDPDDLAILTPGHFLIGEAMTSIPEPDLRDEKMNRLSRWQLCQQAVQRFWKRYPSEYFSRLQQRPKRLQHRSDVRVGDMVLVREENLAPNKWRIGRVLLIHPGNDDETRAVTVKTADGEIKRPIVKLCLLPIDPAAHDPNVDDQI